MTTVLQVHALWVVLSAVAAAGVCLVLTGGRLTEQRRTAAPGAAPASLPVPLRAVDEERAVSA
jgi:hypothetical protein